MLLWRYSANVIKAPNQLNLRKAWIIRVGAELVKSPGKQGWAFPRKRKNSCRTTTSAPPTESYILLLIFFPDHLWRTTLAMPVMGSLDFDYQLPWSHCQFLIINLIDLSICVCVYTHNTPSLLVLLLRLNPNWYTKGLKQNILNKTFNIQSPQN